MTRKGTKAITGVGKKRKTLLRHDLDWLIGVWSREDAKFFDRALEDQRRIDPELWK